MLVAKMKQVSRPAASTSSMASQEHSSSSSSSAKDRKGSPVFIRRLVGMLSRKHSKQLPSNGSLAGGSGRQCGLEKVFDYFDENGDGKISPLELQRCMRAVGEELSEEEVEAVVESSDSDGDGFLGLEDFVKLVEGDGEEEKGKHLRDAFRMYATGEADEGRGGGRITAKSLRRMLRRLGESRTNDECAAMIRRFDINGDGVLSFDEFKIMML